MIDQQSVERAAERFRLPEGSFERLALRRDRRRRDQRIRAGVLGLAIAIAVGWLGVNAIRSTPPVPADDRSEELGIFAPVAGRILYRNDGIDLGYDRGLWGVDPTALGDDTNAPIVPREVVVSALVQLVPDDDAIPLGWSSDGRALLLELPIKDEQQGDPNAQDRLLVLHADGSETPLRTDPMIIEGATISPDGSRVVFAGWSGARSALYSVDIASGTVEILLEDGERQLDASASPVFAPTFSPDGTRIAFVHDGVWVMDADGTDAHQIVTKTTTGGGIIVGLEWSPAGDRIALGLRRYVRPSGIYTFAPNGSGFTRVIAGGISPYWSPDGSQIAYTSPCDEHPEGCSSVEFQQGQESAGLAIVDADGSDAREFGFADSGPWHPASPVADDPSPAAVDGP